MIGLRRAVCLEKEIIWPYESRWGTELTAKQLLELQLQKEQTGNSNTHPAEQTFSSIAVACPTEALNAELLSGDFRRKLTS